MINVSHELRTPLASIQGYTETLLEGAINDDDNNMRFLNIIRHNAERLTRLTADLLTLSRLELRTQEFRFASFRVNDLLADVVDTIRPIAQKKNITMRHEPGPAECEMFCDSEAFYQIVSNLLDNAVKYTPEGGNIYGRIETAFVARMAPSGWNSTCAIPAWAFRPKSSRGCSSAFIAWIKRAAANWAALGWASPS